MRNLRPALAAVLACPVLAAAETFPSPIPISPLEVIIKDVARLPNPDASNVPRMSVATRDPLGRLVVNDQRGPMYTVDTSSGSVVEYFDIRDYAGVSLTNQNPEQGFQGFAFHPDFAAAGTPGFGRFYTLHSSTNTSPTPDFVHNNLSGAPGTTHHEVLLEWRTNDPTAPTFTPADPGNPYRTLLRLDQRYRNHNGGNIAFNPLGGADAGNLYVGLGDGGNFNDPFSAGQDTTTPYGKLLRIDPLGSNSGNGQYGIVAANAFAADSDPNTLGEVYAYGLRNPQRFAWDTANGELYIADIGQGAFEEVNLGVNGGNYGWFPGEGPENTPGWIDPVAAWQHDVALAPHPSPLPAGFQTGQNAVTLGDVFRGSGIPQLDGKLLVGDIPKGAIYLLDVDNDPLDGGGDGFSELIPLEEDTDIAKRLISLINEERSSLGLADATRADLRFSVNTPGEIFILNKRDGVLRQLVIPEPTSLAGLAVVGLALRRRR